MTSRSTVRVTCRLCGHGPLEAGLRMRPQPLGDEFLATAHPQPMFPLNLMLCSRCANVQVEHIVDPDDIYLDYTYFSSVSAGLPEHFDRYAASVMAAHGLCDGLVVELGSNEGAMLKAFKARGMRILGVDPAPGPSAAARAAGLETLTAYFTPALAESIVREHGQARLIVANNVLANIDDLDQVVAGIRILMAADGILLFETSYLLDVVERLLLDTIFHEHMNYFAVAPLALFFQRHGMELVDVERTSPKGGSLRGTVQLRGGPRRAAQAVAELMQLERDRGLHLLTTYRRMEDRTRALGTELAAMLDRLAHGDKVAAYGAAIGGTTLIYELDLAERLAFLVDDNPGKQGTVSPGLHLPVLAPGVLAERRPPAVVLLAWRYQDLILKHQQAYLDRGGAFVLPMPEVRRVP